MAEPIATIAAVSACEAKRFSSEIDHLLAFRLGHRLTTSNLKGLLFKRLLTANVLAHNIRDGFDIFFDLARDIFRVKGRRLHVSVGRVFLRIMQMS